MFLTAAGDFDTVVVDEYTPAAGACITSVTLGLPQPGRTAT